MGNISRLKLVKGLLVLFSLMAFLLGLAGLSLGQAQEESPALLAEVDGIINPVSQRFITGTVKKGEKEGAPLVIIVLDTPGGLLFSTRKIVESLLNAQVPTAVYVAPQGARAASAGTFITAAGHFAVMAPATNIGAATPVSSGGGDLPDTLASKATNDAAALMRSIAEQRGRNAEKLEETVLKATSFTATEAVKLNLVDFIANNLDDLLVKLDGLSVTIDDKEITLETRGLAIRELKMSLIDQFLFIIADPNIAFILLSVGGLGIVIEVLNPGLIFPGLVGAIFLVLAFVSLDSLPVNWGGAALILLAGALFIAEFYVAGFGILGIGGIVCFILGALLLFSGSGSPSSTNPSLGVSPWVLVPFGAVLTLTGGWVIKTIAWPRRTAKSGLSLSPIIGMEGVVTTDLAPRGTVLVQTEVWTAGSAYGTIIRSGEKIKVVEVKGTTLSVVPVEERAEYRGN